MNETHRMGNAVSEAFGATALSLFTFHHLAVELLPPVL